MKIQKKIEAKSELLHCFCSESKKDNNSNKTPSKRSNTEEKRLLKNFAIRHIV